MTYQMKANKSWVNALNNWVIYLKIAKNIDSFSAHYIGRSTTNERAKGATVSVIILVLFIAAITTSVIALARSVIRDGHGRRPEVGSYDSRRPTL